MISSAAELEPLDPHGPTCTETHPTAPSLRCAKRPHAEGAHVAIVRGSPLWWGERAPGEEAPPEKPPGFSRSPRFSGDFLRDSEQAARSLRDDRPARGADLDPTSTRGEVERALHAPSPRPRGPLTGDLCGVCGAAAMVRTGKCLTCQSCGSSDGGCS